MTTRPPAKHVRPKKTPVKRRPGLTQQASPVVLDQISAPQQSVRQPVESSTAQPSTTLRSVLLWPFRWLLRLLWDRKWWLINLVVVGIAILLVLSESVRQSTVNLRYDGNTVRMSDVPHHDTALVFGAGVLPDGTPTEYLRHRVETAVDLYKAHRVDSLLVSGDNSNSHYNEPAVMKAYAVKLGVNPSDVIIDFAGYSTYDSCYRAHAIFGQRSVTVVTQGYHLPRAIYTCQQLGMDTIGVAAQHTGRDWTISYLAREHLSTAKEFVQNLLKPHPTVLGKVETP